MSKDIVLVITHNRAMNNEILARLRNISDKYEIFEISTKDDYFLEIEKNSPSVILLEIIDPEARGQNIIMNLQEYQETKNIPVILLALKKIDEVSQGIIDMLSYDYYRKPFNYETLFDRIDSLVKENRSGTLSTQENQSSKK